MGSVRVRNFGPNGNLLLSVPVALAALAVVATALGASARHAKLSPICKPDGYELVKDGHYPSERTRQPMLLDAVTSALDPELVAELFEVIRELAAGGLTMLIATHEMGFAREIADRVCFLDEGVVLEQGPPEHIFSEPREPRTQQFLQPIVAAGRLAR
jgi:hypothetical protein